MVPVWYLYGNCIRLVLHLYGTCTSAAAAGSALRMLQLEAPQKYRTSNCVHYKSNAQQPSHFAKHENKSCHSNKYLIYFIELCRSGLRASLPLCRWHQESLFLTVQLTKWGLHSFQKTTHSVTSWLMRSCGLSQGLKPSDCSIMQPCGTFGLIPTTVTMTSWTLFSSGGEVVWDWPAILKFCLTSRKPHSLSNQTWTGVMSLTDCRPLDVWYNFRCCIISMLLVWGFENCLLSFGSGYHHSSAHLSSEFGQMESIRLPLPHPTHFWFQSSLPLRIFWVGFLQVTLLSNFTIYAFKYVDRRGS